MLWEISPREEVYKIPWHVDDVKKVKEEIIPIPYNLSQEMEAEGTLLNLLYKARITLPKN